MYGYASDGPIEMRDKSALERRGDVDRPGSDCSKYTVLSFSLSDCEVTWCFGPGISTIFVTKNESPHDFCVFSRGPST
jgi:hypothetical protein